MANQKSIALFGATGKTGQEFLKKALMKGYQVKALVRNPQKLQQKHPRLQVIKGDVLQPADVAATLGETDWVVSLFGHVKGSPEWVQSRGTENILSAMQQQGLRKIISLSGGGLPYEKDRPKLPDYLIRGIMKLVARNILEDATRHAQLLEKSGLDWIIVRAPRLTQEPEKGQYRIGWVGVNASTSIGRADLADFLLKQVEDDRFVHQMPFVSY